MKNYKEMDLWQKAMRLALRAYEITSQFPREEIYGLTSQIRRSATSVPANIAEGSMRQHDGEFIQFLHIALGSCAELETHLLLAQSPCLLSGEQHSEIEALLTDVLKLLRGTIRAKRRGDPRSSTLDPRR